MRFVPFLLFRHAPANSLAVLCHHGGSPLPVRWQSSAKAVAVAHDCLLFFSYSLFLLHIVPIVDGEFLFYMNGS